MVVDNNEDDSVASRDDIERLKTTTVQAAPKLAFSSNISSLGEDDTSLPSNKGSNFSLTTPIKALDQQYDSGNEAKDDDDNDEACAVEHISSPHVVDLPRRPQPLLYHPLDTAVVPRTTDTEKDDDNRYRDSVALSEKYDLELLILSKLRLTFATMLRMLECARDDLVLLGRRMDRLRISSERCRTRLHTRGVHVAHTDDDDDESSRNNIVPSREESTHSST